MGFKRVSILCLTVALVQLYATQAAFGAYDHVNGQLDYKNPVRTAEEDEIKDLPGLAEQINFKQYSGYLRVDTDKKPSKFHHYWFVESQSNPAKDPVLLWLNGGPGCSSMGGLFTELGPFSVNDDGQTLKLNEFSWNKAANVLFLESPTGVGFSYTTNLINVHTDDNTAAENHQALKSFMAKFPRFSNNSLYLSGESYAGVYLPTLGVLADADPELNLKGVAIGNGYLDVGKLTDSLIFFGYYHGLIGKKTWDRLSNFCCKGQAPSREACVLSGSETSFSCRLIVNEVSASIMDSGINPYNLYGDCKGKGKADFKPSKREIIDRALMSFATNSSKYDSRIRPFHVFDASEHRLREEPPCTDEQSLIKYLNLRQVREAIHIPSRVPDWDTCSIIVYVMQYPKLPGGLAPQMKSLINSKRNLTMLVYNGDVDLVCNFLGDEWFVDGLGREVVREYQSWKVNKQIAGWVKHFDGITFATVRGSGHMVPGDRPKEALAMIETFLRSKCRNVHL